MGCSVCVLWYVGWCVDVVWCMACDVCVVWYFGLVVCVVYGLWHVCVVWFGLRFVGCLC